MSENQSPQDLQEREYWFPYHYIARVEDGSFSQTLEDGWGLNYVSTIEYLVGKLKEITFASVIDVGCGDGRFTREVHLHFPARLVVGIDRSAKAIALARAMNQDQPDVQFVAGDITRDAAQGPFDVAVLMEVLEHVPYDEAPAFVAGIRRSMRAGGTLLVTVPHRNKPLEDKHYRHFDSTSIAAALATGFRIAEIVPFERRGWTRGVLGSLLSNRLFMLNHRRLRRRIYDYYRRRLFFCAEAECQRLFVRASAV